MTQLVKYHDSTWEIALFFSPELKNLGTGEYWIGRHSPRLCHQNGEPPYAWIRGDFNTESEGLEALSILVGNEI